MELKLVNNFAVFPPFIVSIDHGSSVKARYELRKKKF